VGPNKPLQQTGAASVGVVALPVSVASGVDTSGGGVLFVMVLFMGQSPC
jgi:NCAIR mutase (PurE)-related protein